MRKLLLITVMLLGSITYAQDTPCNPLIQDGCDVFEPENTEFDFNPDNCIVDFEAVKTELNDIVDLFFEELEYYNDAYVNYGGVYNQEAYDLKQTKLQLYPFDGIVAQDYNVTINTFPFTYGAVADVSMSQNGDITDVTININEDKWHELSDDEYWGNDDVKALAYLKKRMIIYHELGHGVLGLGHPCNTEADIMNTSQCPRADGSQYNLSFPIDFPVENITTFENARNRMFLGTRGGQVLLPVSSSTTSSSFTAAYSTPSSEGVPSQAPRIRAAGETELEFYGDTNLTNYQLQNRIDAIDDISSNFDEVSVKYNWETLNQVYSILLTDTTPNPITGEIWHVANLTTLTYENFNIIKEGVYDWVYNDFLVKVRANN